MNKIKLSEEELSTYKGGEAITIGAVLALMSIGIITIICYKLFYSKSGKTSLPGGYAFQWN